MPALSGAVRVRGDIRKPLDVARSESVRPFRRSQLRGDVLDVPLEGDRPDPAAPFRAARYEPALGQRRQPLLPRPANRLAVGHELDHRAHGKAPRQRRVGANHGEPPAGPPPLTKHRTQPALLVHALREDHDEPRAGRDGVAQRDLEPAPRKTRVELEHGVAEARSEAIRLEIRVPGQDVVGGRRPRRSPEVDHRVSVPKGALSITGSETRPAATSASA